MKSKKFVVSMERVAKSTHTITIEAASVMEAYDHHQELMIKLIDALTQQNTPTKYATYHITKIEEVKE